MKDAVIDQSIRRQAGTLLLYSTPCTPHHQVLDGGFVGSMVSYDATIYGSVLTVNCWSRIAEPANDRAKRETLSSHIIREIVDVSLVGVLPGLRRSQRAPGELYHPATSR